MSNSHYDVYPNKELSMKIAPLLFSSRTFGLAAAGAALLAAPGAFAQSVPSAFQIENDTMNSTGDPLYSVTNNLTFTNLQLTETFANGFSQTLLMPDLNTLTLDESTNPFVSNSPLTSAILTGSLNTAVGSPGSTLTVTLQPTFDPTQTSQQLISDTFSANLFAPAPATVGLGQFALVSSGGITDAPIGATLLPAAVPEASTTVSLGLLLALGLGSVAVARRRAASTL